MRCFGAGTVSGADGQERRENFSLIQKKVIFLKYLPTGNGVCIIKNMNSAANKATYTLSADYVELLELSEEISNQVWVILDSRRAERKIAPLRMNLDNGNLFGDLTQVRVVDEGDLVPHG